MSCEGAFFKDQIFEKGGFRLETPVIGMARSVLVVERSPIIELILIKQQLLELEELKVLMQRQREV